MRFGTNFALLLFILLFLFSYFEPHLIFSDTTPAGGDTPSHFTASERFSDFFLNHGQITGWDYGNLAGYPLLQYYFPLPFVLCALLSVVLPLTVSFKMVTVLSVVLLPLSAFYFLKRLDFQFPVPIMGSAAALVFLFVESQSMWGGNIPSALAGEFSYSLGMALALCYLADFYRGIESKRGIWRNSFLLALTGFSHGCALLVAGATALFCVFLGQDTFDRLKYFAKVNLLAFTLLAFWLIPWLMSQEYMTAFNFQWVFHSWTELFPTILLPLYFLAAVSALYFLYSLLRRKIKDKLEVHSRLLYLWFGALVCLIYFDIGYQLNVVDVRFVPFLQLFVLLIGGVFLGSLFQKVPVPWCFAIATVLLAIAWTDYNSETIRSWIKWNYEGFEEKPKWSALQEVSEFVEGTFEDPRVVYEHSALHDQFGSVRTFESLPYFSGRATLEGVYLQSSINSPFIFYLQSEISEVTSCPLPEYHCSSLNFRRALPHLELFNVSHLILRTDTAKQKARLVPELVLEKSVLPLEIYRRVNGVGRYVVPLTCKPVLYTGGSWKRESFRWYRNYSSNSVPVVIDPNPAQEDLDRFARKTEIFPVGEECLTQSHSCQVEEAIEHNRIRIKTSCIGHPLLVKMSYHPRWQVKGASKVYLAAPGFMLIFPQRTEVELRFGWAGADYLGAGLTSFSLLLGVLGLLLGKGGRVSELWWVVLPVAISQRLERSEKWLRSQAGSRFLKTSTMVMVISFVLLVQVGSSGAESNVLLEEGLEYYADGELDKALEYFQKATRLNPESSFGINARFYWGLSLYRLERYPDAAEVLRVLIEQVPESVHAPEAMYHIALSLRAAGAGGHTEYFQRTIEGYPESRWAAFSQEQLGVSDFALGIKYFDLQDFERAQSHFRKAAEDEAATPDYRTQSQYYVAICDFKREHWSRAREEFDKLISVYPNSVWVAEAIYHQGLCYASTGQDELAKRKFREVLTRFPGTRWSGYARQQLNSQNRR